MSRSLPERRFGAGKQPSTDSGFGIVAGRENTEEYLKTLRTRVVALFPKWEDTNLPRLYKEVNDLKHTANGIFEGRDVKYDEAVRGSGRTI